jgi:hypothetical protein
MEEGVSRLYFAMNNNDMEGYSTGENFVFFGIISHNLALLFSQHNFAITQKFTKDTYSYLPKHTAACDFCEWLLL